MTAASSNLRSASLLSVLRSRFLSAENVDFQSVCMDYILESGKVSLSNRRPHGERRAEGATARGAANRERVADQRPVAGLEALAGSKITMARVLAYLERNLK